MKTHDPQALLRPALLLTGLALLAACASTPAPSPPPSPPSDQISTPSPGIQRDCDRNFDPCNCNIEKFPIDTLDTQLSQPNWSPARRQEVAANLSDVADFYKREYWSNKKQEDALRALRYYGAFLSLVSLSDRSAPYSLLHSIAIYCDLGCRAKANDLVGELKGNYRYQPSELDTVLQKCR